MVIDKQIINATSRSLPVNWSFHSAEDLRRTYYPGWKKDLNPKMCNSVTEAIFREWHRRYKKRNNPIPFDEVFADALAADIAKEIDDEILKEIRAAFHVPRNKM